MYVFFFFSSAALSSHQADLGPRYRLIPSHSLCMPSPYTRNIQSYTCFFHYLNYFPRTYLLAQNQYMQEFFLGESILHNIHAGPVFAEARIQEIHLRKHFSANLPNSWGKSFRSNYVQRLYSHPHEYRQKSIGFMPGSTLRPTVFDCVQINSSLV